MMTSAERDRERLRELDVAVEDVSFVPLLSPAEAAHQAAMIEAARQKTDDRKASYAHRRYSAFIRGSISSAVSGADAAAAPVAIGFDTVHSDDDDDGDGGDGGKDKDGNVYHGLKDSDDDDDDDSDVYMRSDDNASVGSVLTGYLHGSGDADAVKGAFRPLEC
jgi:hypothetical protein